MTALNIRIKDEQMVILREAKKEKSATAGKKLSWLDCIYRYLDVERPKSTRGRHVRIKPLVAADSVEPASPETNQELYE